MAIPLRAFSLLALVLAIALNARAEVAFPEPGGFMDAVYDQDFPANLEAARNGDARAQALVGAAYAIGVKRQDVPVDGRKAAKWIKKAAAQDLAEGLYWLAGMYAAGYTVEKSPEKWLELTAEAGEQGFPKAQSELWLTFRDGDERNNIEPDDEKYLYWLRKYAQSGATIAMRELAGVYLQGKLVAKDEKRAFQLVQKAAEKDDLIAQGYLGDYYAKGIGTEKDLVKAYMMYDLGGTGDIEKKEALAEKMTDEQVQEAIARSRRWQEEHNSVRPSYYGLKRQPDGSYR
ncbi:tetratricopeptide repeat protein [Arhodomonas sp. KWT2]|uniref:tetratricopeptide repeat protein n=1 Tax=Arhodomonas sp. KWT2 TaxID=3344194 RepID=UPI0035BEFC55